METGVPIQELIGLLGGDTEAEARDDLGPKQAMERAGHLLASRPRSTKEMSDRLSTAGFPAEVVDHTIERLTELDLLDDDAFARQWVEERSRRKALGPRALMAELALKGIDPDIAREAVEAVSDDELERATELASRSLRKVARHPLPVQATRLQQMLTRRGYPYEIAEQAVKAVLPPEGWD